MNTVLTTTTTNAALGNAIFLVSLALFLVSFILLTVFSIKSSGNLLWILGMASFCLAVVLCKENIISSFIALLISAFMAVLFGRKGEGICLLSMIFILTGAVLSFMTDYIWLLLAFVPTPILPYLDGVKKAERSNSKSTF